MLQVTTRHTNGQIGVEQTLPSFRMRVPSPTLSLEQTPAEINIDIDWPRIHIDQTKTLDSMGYQNIVPFQKDMAKDGQATVLSGIQRTAAEGDRLGRIDLGGSPFPELAQAAWPQTETNIGLIPAVSPDIYSTGSIEIQSRRGDVNVDSQIRFPKTWVQKGSLDVYLKVKPSITTEVTGQWIDTLG